MLSTLNSPDIHNWCCSEEQGEGSFWPVSAVNTVAAGCNLENPSKMAAVLTAGIPHLPQNNVSVLPQMCEII